MAVVRSKNASPTWSDVKTRTLTSIARAFGLVQDLYTASKDNQDSCIARLAWVMINSNLSRREFQMDISGSNERQPISVSKAKEGDWGLQKRLLAPDGMAELSIFYCEEALGFPWNPAAWTTKNTLLL